VISQDVASVTQSVTRNSLARFSRVSWRAADSPTTAEASNQFPPRSFLILSGEDESRDSLAVVSSVRSTYHFAAGGRADERRGGTNGGSAGSGHAERETVAPRRRRAAGCGTTAPPQQPRMQARTRTRRVLIPIPLRVSVALCRRMCPSSSNSRPASTPPYTASLP